MDCPVRDIRVSWINTAGADVSGVSQTAFEVELLTANRARLWATGAIQSDAQQYRLPGPFNYSTLYAWHVRVWFNTATTPSAFSATLPFDTLPSPSSWAQAQWIGGHNQLRTDVNITCPQIKAARAHVSGLGAFYFYINGQRVSDHILDPAQVGVLLCAAAAFVDLSFS